MQPGIRFSEFTQAVTVKHEEVSYNDLVPKPELDEAGNELPYEATRIRLRSRDVYYLLRPYVSTRLGEQLIAVVPLAAYLVLVQLLILRQPVANAVGITGGLVAVVIGLMLFMEGLKLGLMPFGETIGNSLPRKSPLWMVLLIAFLLGVGVTFAEPAIGALKAAGSLVKAESAPLLYTMLNDWTDALVLVVGVGVGLAAVIGTLRFLYAWSLKTLIFLTLLPTLGLTGYALTDPELSKMLGLAWDCGAVTTGPVTVPLVLSLGIGVASAAGKGSSSLSGFGIVTLASLFPVIAVLCLAIYVSSQTDPAAVIAAASAAAATAGSVAPHWSEQSPWLDIILGVRAIVPLVIFLLIVLMVVLREKLAHGGIIAYGITLTVVGMIIFNLGLSYGLSALGNQAGSTVPAAFADLPGVDPSPLYDYAAGITVAILFAWFLGFGATVAEPALNALGITVETLTNGAFRKSTLIRAVSAGVACGITAGVLKIVYDIPLAAMVLPAYGLAMILTWLSTEEFVNVAWDSAGVTTGPVTVPLVLAMGLGFGGALDAVEGFGILAMASIGPILFVLGTGFIVTWRTRKRHRGAEARQAARTPSTPAVEATIP